MISVITSVASEEKLNSFLLPSIHTTNQLLMSMQLPLIDFVVVSGDLSIAKNYNLGIKKAKYPIKAFVHEDVDLLNPTWIFKMLNAFASDPKIGLVGLVGSNRLSDIGFWGSLVGSMAR